MLYFSCQLLFLNMIILINISQDDNQSSLTHFLRQMFLRAKVSQQKWAAISEHEIMSSSLAKKQINLDSTETLWNLFEEVNRNPLPCGKYV